MNKPEPQTNESREEIGLLPCPFCGNSEIRSQSIDGAKQWATWCHKCGGGFNVACFDKEFTERFWNKRVPLTSSGSSPSVGGVEAESQTGKEGDATCLTSITKKSSENPSPKKTSSGDPESSIPPVASIGEQAAEKIEHVLHIHKTANRKHMIAKIINEVVGASSVAQGQKWWIEERGGYVFIYFGHRDNNMEMDGKFAGCLQQCCNAHNSTLGFKCVEETDCPYCGGRAVPWPNEPGPCPVCRSEKMLCCPKCHVIHRASEPCSKCVSASDEEVAKRVAYEIWTLEAHRKTVCPIPKSQMEAIILAALRQNRAEK